MVTEKDKALDLAINQIEKQLKVFDSPDVSHFVLQGCVFCSDNTILADNQHLVKG